MAYRVRIEADSISRAGCRLTTFVVTLPRNMLAEFNTHKMLSKNSASSRAIPVRTQLQKLMKDPFTPAAFGTDIGGMQAGPPLEGAKLVQAHDIWRNARLSAVESAMKLTASPDFIDKELKLWKSKKKGSFDDFVLHIAGLVEDKGSSFHSDSSVLKTTKGLTNRLLEPFMWHEIIVTGTEWENFFNLRTHQDAQEEIRTAAVMMKDAYEASRPELLEEGEWHLPFIQPEEKEWAKANPTLARDAVTARCARVSYLTHDRAELNLEADYRLTAGLQQRGHMSPFEHAATPFTQQESDVREAMAEVARSSGLPDYATNLLVDSTEFAGNFRGWGQYRREQPNQSVYQPVG